MSKLYFVKGHITLEKTKDITAYIDKNQTKLNKMTDEILESVAKVDLGFGNDEPITKIVLMYACFGSNTQLANVGFKELKRIVKKYYPDMVVNLAARGNTI